MIADYDFWMAFRNALLIILDAIERKLAICPTTADMRREHKEGRCV
jgi:hypothetical protein